jgi:hypothetical protein
LENSGAQYQNRYQIEIYVQQAASIAEKCRQQNISHEA